MIPPVEFTYFFNTNGLPTPAEDQETTDPRNSTIIVRIRWRRGGVGEWLIGKNKIIEKQENFYWVSNKNLANQDFYMVSSHN